MPPAPSFFTSTPAFAISQRNHRLPEFSTRAELSETHGVGLLRIRYTDASYVSGMQDDQNMIWLHDSEAVPVITRFTGRRIDHRPGPRAFCTCPAAADVSFEATGPGAGSMLRISAESLALVASQLASHGSVLKVKMSGYDDALFRIAQVLEAEAAAGHPNGRLFWSSAADALIGHLAAHHLSAPAAPPRGALSRTALGRLDAYIHENLAAPLDLDSLAAQIGCDRYHFAHRFRATVGISPHRYVMRLRLERARERISAGIDSLAEIALDTGFTDQSHLCRWVRRVYALRPTDLRG